VRIEVEAPAQQITGATDTQFAAIVICALVVVETTSWTFDRAADYLNTRIPSSESGAICSVTGKITGHQSNQELRTEKIL
jgi:hypothetical protein